LLGLTTFQRKIVSHAEDPPAEVPLTFPQLEVLEQGKKYFLGDFLAILHGQTKRECVTKQRGAKFLKETNDHAFDFGGSPGGRGRSRCWKPQRIHRAWRRNRHSWLYLYSFFLGFVQAIGPIFCAPQPLKG
jgi:hypothetical protein